MLKAFLLFVFVGGAIVAETFELDQFNRIRIAVASYEKENANVKEFLNKLDLSKTQLGDLTKEDLKRLVDATELRRSTCSQSYGRFLNRMRQVFLENRDVSSYLKRLDEWQLRYCQLIERSSKDSFEILANSPALVANLFWNDQLAAAQSELSTNEQNENTEIEANLAEITPNKAERLLFDDQTSVLPNLAAELLKKVDKNFNSELGNLEELKRLSSQMSANPNECHVADLSLLVDKTLVGLARGKPIGWYLQTLVTNQLEVCAQKGVETVRRVAATSLSRETLQLLKELVEQVPSLNAEDVAEKSKRTSTKFARVISAIKKNAETRNLSGKRLEETYVSYGKSLGDACKQVRKVFGKNSAKLMRIFIGTSLSKWLEMVEVCSFVPDGQEGRLPFHANVETSLIAEQKLKLGLELGNSLKISADNNVASPTSKSICKSLGKHFSNFKQEKQHLVEAPEEAKALYLHMLSDLCNNYLPAHDSFVWLSAAGFPFSVGKSQLSVVKKTCDAIESTGYETIEKKMPLV